MWLIVVALFSFPIVISINGSTVMIILCMKKMDSNNLTFTQKNYMHIKVCLPISKIFLSVNRKHCAATIQNV